MFNFSKKTSGTLGIGGGLFLAALLFMACSSGDSDSDDKPSPPPQPNELSQVALDADASLYPAQFDKTVTSYMVLTLEASATLTVAADGSSEISYSLDDGSNWVSVSAPIIVDNLVTASAVPVKVKVSPAAGAKDQSTTPAVYEFTVLRYQTLWNFTYTESASYPFTATFPGTYTFELWGAEGGNAHTVGYGGKGGYLKAQKTLSANEQLYIFVGKKGNNAQDSATGGAVTWGGGGAGGNKSSSYITTTGGAGGGGGATFVTTMNTTDTTYTAGLKDLAFRDSRVLVAGGGGGGMGTTTDKRNGGCGSGTDTAPDVKSRNNTFTITGGATADGIGQDGSTPTSKPSAGEHGAGGGGGGYKGGNAQQLTTGVNRDAPGAGGSGFVHADWTALSRKTGEESIPKPDGGTENGHSGNGYVRVTFQLN